MILEPHRAEAYITRTGAPLSPAGRSISELDGLRAQGAMADQYRPQEYDLAFQSTLCYKVPESAGFYRLLNEPEEVQVVLDRSQAQQLFTATEEARRQTRSVVTTNWFPMVLFGTLAVVSVPVAVYWSPTAMEALWLFGAPLAGLATALWYRGRDIQIGLSVNPWPYVVTAVAIIIGCSATGIAGRGGPVSYAGPLFVIGVGYLVFGRLDRSRAGAALGAALAVTAIFVFALKPSHVYALTMLPFGVGSILLGLWNLLQAKRTG